MVFSQAAFEHFDDVELMISNLSDICKKGAKLIAEVDLKAHSRWVRDNDPNSIYRYPGWLYNLVWYKGVPNRLRPYQYKEILEKYGWNDIVITPLQVSSRDNSAYSGIHKDFQDRKNEMNSLTIMLYATKQ